VISVAPFKPALAPIASMIGIIWSYPEVKNHKQLNDICDAMRLGSSFTAGLNCEALPASISSTLTDRYFISSTFSNQPARSHSMQSKNIHLPREDLMEGLRVHAEVFAKAYASNVRALHTACADHQATSAPHWHAFMRFRYGFWIV
jgi:hypothetical protein